MAEIEIKRINDAAKMDVYDFISRSENNYTQLLLGVADKLERDGIKIVLLAGPSGSGKTTTANILKDVMEERGHKTAVISLDNFYRDMHDPLYPRDEVGALDYEAVDALDVAEIRRCIKELLRGNYVRIPKYIFGEGISKKDEIPIALPYGGLVIIEGLHAINPTITEGIENKGIVRIFISVSTNINEGERRILSGRKIRFVRRMTRDSLYRGTDAAGTLERWESVLRGEDKYLYPLRELADITINTFHEYELGVMKPFAELAIKASEDKLNGEYIKIIKNALAKVDAIDDQMVPATSLIREFIPGGKYESLY